MLATLKGKELLIYGWRGSCMQPGVEALFRQRFPELQVHLPQHSLFMTPLAIANSGRAKAEGLYAS